MSPGVADQLLLLIDEIEELTGEIFAAVQNQGTSDNLIDMLIKKDRKLATLLNTAEEQKHLYQKIENVSPNKTGEFRDTNQTVFSVLIFISVGDYWTFH